MGTGTRTKDQRSYVLGQPETITILLGVLEMQLLVEFEVQFSAHADMLFVEGITDLVRNC